MESARPGDGLEVIDEAPVGRFHRKLLIACCGGPFLDGYVISLIGVAMIGIAEHFTISATMQGLIGAAAIIGTFFGATIFGALTDRIGREKMYALDLAVLVVACVLSAGVTAIWQLIALRFIIGMAIGADYPIATSLLTEFTPKKRRGYMIGLSALAWMLGAMAAFVVGFLFVLSTGDHSTWRWMLFSGGVVGIIVVLLRRGIPESPRWLLAKGRVEEAHAVIRQVYGHDVDLAAITASDEEQPKKSILHEFASLVRGGYLKRTVMCSVLYLAQVTPQYALFTFGAVILAAAGLEGDNAATLGELVIVTMFALGNLIAIKLIESWGRRPMTIVPFALMTVALVALGAWDDSPSWFIIAMFAFYAVVNGGPSVLEWVYPNELFPTEIRATAVGAVVGISRIGAAIGTFLLPIGIASIGSGPVLLIGAAMTALAFLACLAWAPETKNRSLAETSMINPPVAVAAKMFNR